MPEDDSPLDPLDVFPELRGVEAELVGVTDEEEAAAILERYGIDKKTAGRMAARHCGTYRGGVIES